MAPSKALLLTGPPGSGKTTLIKRAVSQLGTKSGGFYTAEIRERGQRVGVEIVTLDGDRAIRSHVSFKSVHRVGRYGVDVEALERVGVTAIRNAIRSGSLVIIDEIGKMELYSEEFRAAVLEAFEGEQRLLGTIMLASHPWADRLKRDPRTRLLTMTKTTSEAPFKRTLHWLRE